MKLFRTLLFFACALSLNSTYAQNLMNIHQGNGTLIQIPLESIDSVRFVTVPPPTIQKIFQSNGNILSIAVSDIDSITYTIPNNAALATISTQAVTVLSSSSAYSGGTITSDGGSAITQRGVCWSTSPNPTLANNFSVDGTGIGSYGSNLAPLQSATTYYARAYAVNSEGTAYGNQLVFTTSNPSSNGSLATITTANVIYTAGLTASCGGNITADGGLAVTARGVCWAIGTTPTINNNITVDGAGGGNFTSTLTNLLPNTSYFVRAYATNDAGTAYGIAYSFTTFDLPAVTTNPISNILLNSASGGGVVVSNGGSNVISRGVCWSTLPNPMISSSITQNGSGVGSFSSNIISLDPSTTYYVRAYATNSIGTVYGNQEVFTTISLPTITTNEIISITSNSAVSGGDIVSDGGSPIIQKGVCWSTQPNPNISSNTTQDGSGGALFSSNINGLTPATTYYIRAYAINSGGVNYGNELTFITNTVLATITTNPISNITGSFATSGGSISGVGGSSVTQRGVCWSIIPNPTISDNITNDGSGTGSFTSTITGLTINTNYYVRAYAINSAGTAYGDQQSFTTTNIGSNPGEGVTFNGYTYSSVVLGNGQEWMAENLRTANYRNGDPIPTGLDNATWSSTTSGAYAISNNVNDSIYGKLYNWYAIADVRNVCPTGWHVPSDAEWTVLTIYLGGEAVAGGKMKSTGTTNWAAPNLYATNEIGFSGLPAGFCFDNGGIDFIGASSFWWSSTENESYTAWNRNLSYLDGSAARDDFGGKNFGFSVRCLRD